MPKVYTKTGDQGTTGLMGGRRVRKDDLRIHTYGTIDELNSFLGLVIAMLETQKQSAKIKKEIPPILIRIQKELFNVGCQLANPQSKKEKKWPHITDQHVKDLELMIDRFEAELPPLRQFILPGNHPIAATLHVARSICRRAERQCVSLCYKSRTNKIIIQYLNRLSDGLFVLARWVSKKLGMPETYWKSD